MEDELAVVSIPVPPKSFQFEENEETFNIQTQMYISDCFQRREILLNDLVQITLPQDRSNGNDLSSNSDEESCDFVFQQIKGTNNLESRSFSNTADFLNYISHQKRSTSSKSSNNRRVRKVRKYNSNACVQSETIDNIKTQADGSNCYVIDDVEIENVLQSDKNVYLDQTIEIPLDLKTTDYTLLTQAADSSSFINLQGDFENDVMMNFDNSYESEKNETKGHYIIHSVMNGDVYMSKKTSDESYYEDNQVDVESEESYTLFNLDGDQDFHPKLDGMKKSDVRCERCGRKCRSLNALNHHMLVHSEARPFVCQICKKAFKEQPTLRRHMWTHMAKQHQCDICKKYFVEKSSLRRHMSTIHADFRPGSKVSHTTSKQQFCCSKCTKIFKSLTKFNMHAQMHGNPNYECEVCGKVYAGRSHLKIHQRIHTGEKPFQCSICGARFAFKHVLKSHQARIHHRINKFKCNICSLVFLKKSDLSNHATCHMISMKKDKRPYNSHKSSKYGNIVDCKKAKCMLKCSAASDDPEYTLFGQLVDLSNNDKDDNRLEEILRRNDKKVVEYENSEGEKYFSSLTTNEKKDKRCKKCFKEFERTGDLKRHVISHIVQDITNKAKEDNQTIPDYICRICGLTGFHQVDKFKAHLREHAKLTLYKCKYCERAFGDSSNYSKHKKVHGNKYLQCDMCRRKFNTKRMLISHMEYHKGHPPTRCGYCNKQFYFLSSFRKHMKISHQGKANVTYKCEYCGDRFKTVKEKWEHQWDKHQVRKVQADCKICGAKFRKLCLLRAHILKEHGESNVDITSPTITIKEEPLDIFTNTEFLLCTEDIELSETASIY